MILSRREAELKNDRVLEPGLPPLGFFGLSHPMGAAIAERLIEAGYAVYGFDANPEVLRLFEEHGGYRCRSVTEAAGSGELVLTWQPRPEELADLMVGSSRALEAIDNGAVWVDLTTNRSDDIRRLADAAPSGVRVVDAPVSGTPEAARRGELDVFLGGDTASVDRALPVLGHLGDTARCGPLGTGNVVRLVTSQLRAVPVSYTHLTLPTNREV